MFLLSWAGDRKLAVILHVFHCFKNECTRDAFNKCYSSFVDFQFCRFPVLQKYWEVISSHSLHIWLAAQHYVTACRDNCWKSSRFLSYKSLEALLHTIIVSLSFLQLIVFFTHFRNLLLQVWVCVGNWKLLLQLLKFLLKLVLCGECSVFFTHFCNLLLQLEFSLEIELWVAGLQTYGHKPKHRSKCLSCKYCYGYN